MKHCGYCDIDTLEPCEDSKKAMGCSKDIDAKRDAASKKPEYDDFSDGMMDPPLPVRNDAGCQCGYCDACTMPSRQTGGRKFDDDKPRMDLIPPELNLAVAEILKFGAAKYSDRNWEEGMKWGRVFGAMMRHLWSWWGRSHMDNESGYSHLWHAACCLAFLIAYEQRGIGIDDRYEKPKENQ